MFVVGERILEWENKRMMELDGNWDYERERASPCGSYSLIL